MILTRIVSNDEYAHLQVTSELLRKFQVLLWQDPATNDILKAFSHEGKICPVVEAWRKLLKR